LMIAALSASKKSLVLLVSAPGDASVADVSG